MGLDGIWPGFSMVGNDWPIFWQHMVHSGHEDNEDTMKGGVKREKNPKINPSSYTPILAFLKSVIISRPFRCYKGVLLKILLMSLDNFHVQHFLQPSLFYSVFTAEPPKYTWVVWNGVRMRSPALEALGRSLRGETGLAPSALTSLAQKVIACAVYPPEEDHSLWALEIFNASPVPYKCNMFLS